MRVVILLLLTVLLALQYRLWFGKNSLPDYWRLQQEVKNQQATNDSLKRRNQVLYADIEDLREGEDALEERARNELGMIKKDEVFFRIIPSRVPKSLASKDRAGATQP
ncbi:cell division protein FtsB [Idiomarina sp. OT37-5b]|jgi:cell division protein FtsB|uniref:Cell division protein FtsB n=1 Tax=Idiomarina aquatica TaxID=1327752 RepID=A0AA94EF41_9GAMM|nr:MULTISPECIES: cell division protein FtsB [Idiomarina]AVJ55739.1 cell division protein FtsB [Idiomarina sp. OT37-5b]RUO44650.1 cell division protein FtsB [Idiomarina aquatica]